MRIRDHRGLLGHSSETLESLKQTEVFLGYYENLLNFASFGCFGGWEVETNIEFSI
jgi:hypothetical protein